MFVERDKIGNNFNFSVFRFFQVFLMKMSGNDDYRTFKGFEMNEDRLNELLERCESPIERELLQNLYPHLTRDGAQELRAQHMIDYYRDMDLTIPDFAFSEAKIAVYCDGFAKA